MLVRYGECKRCGKCCGLLGWLTIPDDYEFIEWLLVRTKGVKVKEDENNPGEMAALIPQQCQHLKIGADGIATCAIYTKPEMPHMCKVSPTIPFTEIPECGFCFVEEL